MIAKTLMVADNIDGDKYEKCDSTSQSNNLVVGFTVRILAACLPFRS
jgi:hypothetical protein